MDSPSIHAALRALEEAIELGEPDEVADTTTTLGVLLDRAPEGADLHAGYAALRHEIAAASLDRAQCAVLVQRMRGRLGPEAAPTTVFNPTIDADAELDEAPAADFDPARGVHFDRVHDHDHELDHDHGAGAEPRWTVAADSQDVLRDFGVEARALLDEAEQAFLVLETAGGAGGVATAFRAFHTIKGVAGFLELDVLAAVAHRTESLLAEVRDGVLPVGPCVDVVLTGIDVVRGLIDCALRGAAGDLAAIDVYYQHLDAATRACGAAPASAVVEDDLADGLVDDGPRVDESGELGAEIRAAIPAVVTAERRGERPAAARAEPAPESVTRVISAAPTTLIPVQPGTPRRDDDGGMVKVDIHKMDGLVDLVGELAIAQAQLANDPTLATLTTPSLLRSVATLARVARDLQRAALAMRMVAIKGTFDRMARVARDTARSLGKPISFVIEGGQTELDRTMVDAIYDPLVHLVRNAIDHGLEGTIERARRGKPTTGTLTLRAYHRAGQVVVELIDDGGGLDHDKILARARQRGIIAADAVLTPDEIHHLIFTPGFSTAAAVTAVSGRGVGMDVVKTNIEKVRGRVEIDSTPGAGTTIRLKLPLTLAIIDGLLVGVGGERYVLPATWAREIFRPAPEQLVTIQARGQMVKVRGTLYPVHRLADLLGVRSGGDGDGVMIMVDHGSRALCLQVERLLGKQEVVVKTLGAMVAVTSGVAGGAILGDGRIALILDVPTLLGAPSGAPERQVA